MAFEGNVIVRCAAEHSHVSMSGLGTEYCGLVDAFRLVVLMSCKSTFFSSQIVGRPSGAFRVERWDLWMFQKLWSWV